jgi:hypothetical protein
MELETGLHRLSFPDLTPKLGGKNKLHIHFNRSDGGGGGSSDESPIHK